MKQSEIQIRPAKLLPQELPDVLKKVNRRLSEKLKDDTVEHRLQPEEDPEVLIVTVKNQVMTLLTQANLEHFVLDLTNTSRKKQTWILKRDKINKVNIEDELTNTILEEVKAIMRS